MRALASLFRSPGSPSAESPASRRARSSCWDRRHLHSTGLPQLLGTALIGLPAFIGAFWGAPLIARELGTGTHRLVWTQSVTRGRWLAIELAVAAVAAVATAALFSATFTWWSVPLDQFGNRVGTANFGQRGVAPVAYALFASRSAR